MSEDVCRSTKASSVAITVGVLLGCFVAASIPSAEAAAPSAKTAPPLRVARVWSGHPVGFCLLTRSNHQFVAYYDENRQMTVASRKVESRDWTYTQLPQKVGWDSHNYITMAMDATGHLHLSGNMHVNPLVYFRSRLPLQAASLEQVKAMVGADETRTTYPVFLNGPGGDLIFTYRSGSSGNGNQFYNIYDTKNQTWRRLIDKPLLDGGGQKNAYLHGPVQGPDGWLHLCWVWRETPACETSHYVCYARSRDWVQWENSAGQPLKLPITFESAEVIDPVPIEGGVINGNVKLGFDAQKRPVVSYHKFDTNGLTQVYNARLEGGRWKIQQATNWKYRWEFKGGGSIDFEIRVGEVSVASDGSLQQHLAHPQEGSRTLKLDPVSLNPAGFASKTKNISAGPARLESSVPGMKPQQRNGIGDRSPAGNDYLLRWETLPPNRDQARPGPIPPPSWLTVWEVRPNS